MVKIAVASSDGRVVNQHFGRADSFLILEVNEDDYSYKTLEIRETPPICHGADHNDELLEIRAKELSDCQIVLVSRIGQRALNALNSAGIEAYESPGFIDEEVVRILKFIKVQKLLIESFE